LSETIMPETEKILIIDDELDMLRSIAEVLEREGFEVDTADSGPQGLKQLRDKVFDIVITDLRMPEVDGETILSRALELYPDIVVIMMTGYASIETAVKTMKMGAFHYLAKPFKPMELTILVRKAIEQKQLRDENRYLRSQLKSKYRFDNIVGTNEKMQELFRLVEKVANTNSTVLITGESGTGKELIARALHYNSDRRDNPLVTVNCGAIPETLLEDELFGHVKGAFTGAIKDRLGRFEQANNGSLFLDEIGTMPPSLQVKLLRILQERSFERVGGTKTVKVDVRVITATSVNLEEAVQQGQFREDLYYRLNVIPAKICPLRERKDDIPLLAAHFLRKFCKEQGQAVKTISQSAIRQMMGYDWKGNVRQLENAMERAVTLSGDNEMILPADLPPEIRDTPEDGLLGSFDVPEDGINLAEVLATLERRLIRQSLKRAAGNKKKAAELLQVKRTTLVEKIKRINQLESGPAL
jgi:DNA-binding NtrC family response regulator